MLTLMKRVLGDRKGATAIEYGLIAALIVIAMMGALSTFAGESIEMWDRVADEVAPDPAP